MLFHPLIKTLATRPHMLVDHLGAYAELAAVQATEALQGLRMRALLLAGLALSVTLGSIFSGVALLMLAVTPIERMATPWLLWSVPAVPWLLALVCAGVLKNLAPTRALDPLREQFAADAALLKEAGET